MPQAYKVQNMPQAYSESKLKTLLTYVAKRVFSFGAPGRNRTGTSGFGGQCSIHLNYGDVVKNSLRPTSIRHGESCSFFTP